MTDIRLRLNVVDSDAAAEESAICTIRALHCLLDKALVVSGNGPTSALADQIATSIAKTLRTVILRRGVSEATEAAVAQLCQVANCEHPGFVVAVGGGKVLDTAKAACFRLGIPLIILPTALSSDGIASPISVVRTGRHDKQSSFSILPSAVIVNTASTSSAPPELAASGLCDLLSNASSLLDAKEAARRGFGALDPTAAILAESAYRHMLPVQWEKLHCADGHARLARALVMSGLAMAFAKSSAPCSGAEHAICHGLDALGLERRVHHGFKVGVCTVYCHCLRVLLGREGLPAEVVKTLGAVTPALLPRNIGVDRRGFLEAIRIGRELRPDRFTFLRDVTKKDDFAKAFDFAFTVDRDFRLAANSA